MHLANPGDQFRLAQEKQYGRKRPTYHAPSRHAPTHISPEHFSDHHIERDHRDDPHGWDLDAHLGHVDGETHDLPHTQERLGLPVHDAYHDLLLK